jgi:heat shock protein HtpX
MTTEDRAPTAGPRAAGAATVVVALVVFLGWLALLVGWVALLTVDRGWSRVAWAVFGAFVFWNLRPRPPRVRREAVPVTAEEAPGLHALVTATADAVGTVAPRRILLDTTYVVAALPVGYGARSDLVIGLPQWTVLRPRERVAAVAMVLAGLDVHHRPLGVLVRLASDLLVAGRELLEPPGAVRGDVEAAAYSVSNPLVVDPFEENRVGRSLTKNVGAAGLMAVGAPLRWVQSGLLRSWRPALVPAAYDADARAAAVAGRDAVVGVLLSTVGTPLGSTAAASAARYGRDPFEALETVGRPERAEYRRLLAAEGDGRQAPVPLTSQRLDAVERGLPSTAGSVDPALARQADADVVRLRPEFLDRLTDELRGASD